MGKHWDLNKCHCVAQFFYTHIMRTKISNGFEDSTRVCIRHHKYVSFFKIIFPPFRMVLRTVHVCVYDITNMFPILKLYSLLFQWFSGKYTSSQILLLFKIIFPPFSKGLRKVHVCIRHHKYGSYFNIIFTPFPSNFIYPFLRCFCDNVQCITRVPFSITIFL